MRFILRQSAPRILALVAFALGLGARTWSYYRPAGIYRLGDRAWIAESDHGSINLVRLCRDQNPLFYFTFYTMSPGWHTFVGHDVPDGIVSMAVAPYCRTSLGFGFGLEHPPTSRSDKKWWLDGNGNPVLTVYGSNRGLPPYPNFIQFAGAVPWWFVSLITLLLLVLTWRKTRPRYSGFPITPNPPAP
jgi:hypothetical protein